MIPVYHQDPNTSMWFNDIRVTIKGRNISNEPTYVSSEFYNRYKGMLLLAPLNRDYLESLFGKQRFANVEFSLGSLNDLKIDFLKKLSDKIGFIDYREDEPKWSIAYKIKCRIKEEMGIC